MAKETTKMTSAAQGRGWVTLLGGADPSPDCIATALRHAPMMVAADGAANHAISAGYVPDRVVGDLDSLSDDARARIPADRIEHVGEQDTTDFEKCLTRIDAPLVLATGVTGRRLDHALAVLNTLVRHQTRPCIVFDDHDVIFAAPPKIRLDLEAGTRVSLFPLARVTGRSEGLYWPINGLDFSPDSQIGTSNRATGPVDLTFHIPGMLIILPRAALDVSLRALAPAD